MIAPASYPVSGAEAIVNIKLLKALSASDRFEIDLVSKKYYSSNYPSGDLNSYGVNLNSIHIESVENRINLKTLYQHIACQFALGVVFKGCHWAYSVRKVVKELIRKNSYDYVLTKGELAIPLGNYARDKGIKWVATWNDPCPSSMYPPPYGRGVEYKGTFSDRILIRMMKKADVHIFPNERLANYMQPIVKATKSQIRIIPHVVLENDRHATKSDCMRIIHSGNLYPPRSPKTFLKGLKEFVAKYGKPNVKFCMLGNLSTDDQNLLVEYELDNYIEYLQPVEYFKSLSMLNEFDVAVIIEADCEEGIYLPTKVSDFMQMQIPIFTVSPSEGVLNDLYKAGNIPYFADIKDANDIACALDKIYSDYKNGNIRENIIPLEYLPETVVNTYFSL